jgi:peptide/nickel transport system permease protein
MARYLLKRLLYTLPTLFGVSVLVFLTLHLTPGDPAQVILGPKATETSLAALRRELGLDQPIYVQYWNWLGNALQGDWGRSIQLKERVLTLVWERFKPTLLLSSVALFLAAISGVALGVLSAVRAGGLLDRSAILVSLVGYSLPAFFLGLLLQLAFGLKLGWLPVAGMYPPGSSSLLELLKHLILPSFTLSAGIAALIARMTRATMLEALRMDYVRTARAKGLAERLVTLRHTLRNALIPILTVLGLQVGYVLGGAVLVEQVFAWPGIGTLAVGAILARDFPLIQGVILLVALVYVFSNLITDFLYTLADPRISYE